MLIKNILHLSYFSCTTTTFFWSVNIHIDPSTDNLKFRSTFLYTYGFKQPSIEVSTDRVSQVIGYIKKVISYDMLLLKLPHIITCRRHSKLYYLLIDWFHLDSIILFLASDLASVSLVS